MKRFILVRHGKKNPNFFPNVVIHDTSEVVPAIIDNRPTKIYKPISDVMHYLDAYPLMKQLNDVCSKETVIVKVGLN